MLRSVDKKILTGFISALLLILVVGVVSYQSTLQSTMDARLVDQTHEVIATIRALLSNVTDAETGARGFVITGDEQFLEPFNASITENDFLIRELRELTKDNTTQQANIDSLLILIPARLEVSKENIRVRQSEGFGAAQQRVSSGSGKRLHDHIRRVIATMEKIEYELLAARERTTEAEANRTLLVEVTGTFLVFMIIGIALFLIGRDNRRRKLAEAETQSVLARLDAVFKGATQVSIIATDLDGIITAFNTGAESMLGYTAEEIVGKQTPAIIHLESEVISRGDELTRQMGRPVQGFDVFVEFARQGKHEVRDWTYMRKGGAQFPVSLAVTALREKNGTPTGFLGIAVDISERKRAEEQFRLVVESASNAIVLVDEHGNIMIVNSQAEKYFQFDRVELIGKPIEVLIPGRYRARHPDHRSDFFNAPHDRSMGVGRDLYGLRKDGTEFPIEVGLSPIKTSEGVKVLSSIVDITQRKEAEEERSRLTKEMKLLLESSGEGIYGIDLLGRCTFVNKSAEVLLGYTSPEMLGANIHKLIHHSYPNGTPYPIDDCPIFKSFRTGENCRIENEVLWRKDGSSFPTEYSSSPLLEGNEIKGAVVTFSDITLRKRAEQELREANARLLEVDRLKSQFLATMSHELRTPLNSIIGFTGIILQGLTGPITEEQKKQLTMVYGSAKHLLSLINDILDLSRIESDKIDIYRQTFNIREVIAEVSATLQPISASKGLRLVTDLAEPLPDCQSDRKKVFQILLNLTNNAVKFTERGEVRIACHADQTHATISVSDTGMGIKPESMKMLFEAFRQVDGTAQRKFEGTGLGLHLSKRLAEILGGTITAESEYGVGSRFSFTLPFSN